METWLTVLAVLAAGVYLGMPLIVLRSFRKPAEPGVLNVSDLAQVPSQVTADWHRFRPDLEEIGFEMLDAIAMDRESEGMEAYGMILRHPAASDLAMVMSIVYPQKRPYLEFSTDFQNGQSVNTNNAQDRPLDIVMNDDKKIFWLPFLRDPAELYRAHAALCRAEIGAAPKPAPDMPDLAAHLRDEMREDYEYAERAGLFRRDPVTDGYTLTVRGAYSLTWMHLWPESAIMRWRRARQDRAKLARALGR